MLDRPNSFFASQGGTVAVVFAVILAATFLFVGAAVDYGRTINARSTMQAAADSAALAAAGAEGSIDEKEKIGAHYLASNLAKLGYTANNSSVSIGNGTATVEFDVLVPTTFMHLANLSNLPVSVRSTAAVQQAGGEPHDIYFVLDMSASLGMAADAVERQRLKDLTAPLIQATGGFWLAENPNGCAFACHRTGLDIPGSTLAFEPPGKTTYQLAKEAGIRLREDILLDASTEVIDNVLDPSSPGVSSGDVRIGVLGFSNRAEWLSEPTSDKNVAKLSLSKFPSADRWDTAMDESLPWVDSETKRKSGDHKRSIVLVTDGVRGGIYWDTNWAPIDVGLCDDIKSGGAELYVIETKYEEEPGDFNFEFHVRHFYDTISPSLQQCASPGKYFLASDPDQISQAFKAVGKLLSTSELRLTH
jgi:Flp pilus assembly protein TadG